MEAAAANAFLGELGEPAFDQIEPGIGGRSKVHVEAAMAPEPGLHASMFVCTVVVDDDVQV